MSITIASIPAFAAACRTARTITLSAYTLREGTVEEALLAAAHAGAKVRVRLERDPYDDAAGTLHAANAATISALRAAGADAATTAAGEPVLHMKAAVTDGVAWLDDRNWAGDGHETVLRDTDGDDVQAVSAALDGQRGSDGHFRSDKAGSQYLEAGLIREAGAAAVAVESESFGSGLIYNALLHRAQAGLPTRLLVAGREALQPGKSGDTERARLAKLKKLGVEVRTGNPQGVDYDEKLAFAHGRAWIGSTNATYAHGPAGLQRDWGMFTRDPALVDGIRTEFEQNWLDAMPFDPSKAPASSRS